MSPTEHSVPPALRPVLEALGQASDHRDWMSRAAEIDAAYQQLSDVCRAALASDAEKTQGELCPECGGTGGFGPGGFCPNSGEWQGEVCEECGGTGKPREPAAAPPTNAPEISTSLVDAGLDRKEKQR